MRARSAQHVLLISLFSILTHHDEELSILQPVLMVTLGRFATRKFLPGEKLTQVHGTLTTVTWGDPAWVGPAAIVNAHRFLFDSRDHGAAERLAILSDRLGVFRCRAVFNCIECCPRGSPVTDLIEQVKRAALYGDTTGK